MTVNVAIGYCCYDYYDAGNDSLKGVMKKAKFLMVVVMKMVTTLMKSFDGFVCDDVVEGIQLGCRVSTVTVVIEFGRITTAIKERKENKNYYLLQHN